MSGHKHPHAKTEACHCRVCRPLERPCDCEGCRIKDCQPKGVKHNLTYTRHGDIAGRLVAIEQELHQTGMHVTARAVNAAVRAVGWEFSGDVTAAGIAAREEHRP